MNYYVISCGNTKRDQACKARDLYIGGLFVDTLNYVETTCSVVPHETRIISAKYGLIKLDDVIEPYNIALASLGPPERNALRLILSRQIQPPIGVTDTAICLAGAPYVKLLSECWPGKVEEPLKGLNQGQRRGFYKKAREVWMATHPDYVPHKSAQ